MDAFIRMRWSFLARLATWPTRKFSRRLQAMVKRGQLNVPVIGVAKAGWDLDQLKAGRAIAWKSMADSMRPPLRSCRPAALCRRRLQRSSDLSSFAQRAWLRQAPGPLPGHSAESCSGWLSNSWPIGLHRRRPGDRRKAVWTRSGFGPGTERDPARHLRRDSDLSDRSLSRKTAGA